MEDADSELEALQALYGDECRLRRRWPPDVEILVRPRTAEDMSQQFVEAVLAIRGKDQYPSSPPSLEIVSSKGLDEARQTKLLWFLWAETSKLLNQPMLVIIAEAAAEFLTMHNYAAGDCCFCLQPLMDHTDGQALSMMKLVSCFHCFHTICFARWWTWLRSNNCKVPVCPICRAAIEDIGQIEELVAEAKTSSVAAEEQKYVIPENLREKQDEHRRVFEKHLEDQRARGGIIEKREVLRPGMTVTVPAPTADIDVDPSVPLRVHLDRTDAADG